MTYRVVNDEIKSVLIKLAGIIGNFLPASWGFTLFLFNYTEEGKEDEGQVFYMSSATRESSRRMLQEWIVDNDKEIKKENDANNRDGQSDSNNIL